MPPPLKKVLALFIPYHVIQLAFIRVHAKGAQHNTKLCRGNGAIAISVEQLESFPVLGNLLFSELIGLRNETNEQGIYGQHN